MTIAWRTLYLTPIEVLTTDSNTAIAAIAKNVRASLLRAGGSYDQHFPPLPADDVPSVLVESADHIAWRASTAAALATLDEIAAAVDGEPATTIDSSTTVTLNEAKATVQARLRNAASEDAFAALASETFTSSFATEPQFYVDAAYTYVQALRWGWQPYSVREHGQAFEAELAMNDAIAEAAALLAL